MKAVYNAIRALLYPQELQGHAGTKSANAPLAGDTLLYQVFAEFELRARGFRDMLNVKPFLGVGIDMSKNSLAYHSSVTLDHLTLSLVRVLYRSYQLPNIPELAGVLDAVDTSGRVLRAVETEVKNLTKVVLTGLPGDYKALVSLERQHDDTIMYCLEVYCPHVNETAVRKVALPSPHCSTLRQAHSFLCGNEMTIQEVLESLPSWPEFQPTAPQQLQARLGQKLHDLVANLSTEERLFMLANWSSLRPQAL